MHAIGIDNGVSGSIGIISKDGRETSFVVTPTKSEQNYTKTKKNITRIDVDALTLYLKTQLVIADNSVHVMLERPLVNPGRLQATFSALRALEATIIVLEALKIPYEYMDSKAWQKLLLPQGIKGSDELKKASHDIGCRLFPQFKTLIDKQGDADGILIAEYCRRVR